ncbi:MAG: hypothetical protein JXJ22_12080 [Bacteroidales bacterium]|nr:hypothetical protein [Bacteroidales bacterium]
MKIPRPISNKSVIFFLLILPIFSSCIQKPAILYTPDNSDIFYTGRIDFSNPEHPILSGAGAYFQVKFKGNSCTVLLEDMNSDGRYNYISYNIDGNYQGRIKLEKDSLRYELASGLNQGSHTLLVCKATEAMLGPVGFSGIECQELLPAEVKFERKIEFIGNSITSGTGLDLSEIPCDSGQWHDQHNALLAYGPVTAQKLNANWLLSSVSGIGITRTWNQPAPKMADVYKNLYLNVDSAVSWKVQNYIPDLVSICLGTNDFSGGDGSYNRQTLDSVTFVDEYISFLKLIRTRYPLAKICCLNSPVFNGQQKQLLANYLFAAAQYMKDVEQDENVYLFSFSEKYVNGCSGHPDSKEHQKMANELVPFFKEVMNW